MPRPTDWVDTTVNLEISTGNQSVTSLITGLSPSDMWGVTVIRTIIMLSAFSNTVAGAFGCQQLDLGIGIASQEAFAAGVLPDPNISTDKPPRGWMWRVEKVVSQNGAGAPIVTELEADIRGARKVENGEVYLIGFNTALLGTTFQVNVRGLIRQLYKL